MADLIHPLAQFFRKKYTNALICRKHKYMKKLLLIASAMMVLVCA
jgi:hypothetical protein